MAQDEIRYDRFQLNPGDITWETGPFDVPQEAQDAVEAKEQAELEEGRKLILREKLAAEQRRRAKGKQDS